MLAVGRDGVRAPVSTRSGSDEVRPCVNPRRACGRRPPAVATASGSDLILNTLSIAARALAAPEDASRAASHEFACRREWLSGDLERLCQRADEAAARDGSFSLRCRRGGCLISVRR